MLFALLPTPWQGSFLVLLGDYVAPNRDICDKMLAVSKEHGGASVIAVAACDDAFPPEEGLVKRFLRLARESMRDPGVTVELLARKLGVHRTTLTALFRAEMEITPGAYLDNLRLLHALSLLRETGMPVKEVAEHSGFMNISYFCRLVRKAVGCPPLEYRRKAGPAAKNAGNGKISV